MRFESSLQRFSSSFSLHFPSPSSSYFIPFLFSFFSSFTYIVFHGAPSSYLTHPQFWGPHSLGQGFFGSGVLWVRGSLGQGFAKKLKKNSAKFFHFFFPPLQTLKTEGVNLWSGALWVRGSRKSEKKTLRNFFDFFFPLIMIARYPPQTAPFIPSNTKFFVFFSPLNIINRLPYIQNHPKCHNPSLYHLFSYHTTPLPLYSLTHPQFWGCRTKISIYLPRKPALSHQSKHWIIIPVLILEHS